MEDPSTNYPKPPFQRQSQPFPGLAGKMDPKPDHGGTSYKGSGRLAGRTALITGSDSGMGLAAAIAYAREGAHVALNYLPDEEPNAKEVIALIEKEGRKGVALPGDLRNQAFCEKLVEDAVKALGGLDILINNKGIRVNGVAPGPIWTPLQVSGGATMEKLATFGGVTPTGRPGQPAELGSIYVQLADNGARNSTGQVYGAAGGGGQP
jgi:NAD(P)-dependent dehydrogenase (short-subunit alcohol dehydrogenase family)